MRIIKSIVLSAVLAVAAAGAVHAESKPVTMMRDAREMVPEGMLGVWKVDPNPARPGVTQLRSFQMTEQGMLMVNFITIAADGKQSIGHWWLQVDGVTPGFEYRNDNASTPIAVIRLKKVDDYTFDLTNSVAGAVASRTQYKFSPDFKTFTLTRAPGTPNAQAVVYHKWDGR